VKKIELLQEHQKYARMADAKDAQISSVCKNWDYMKTIYSKEEMDAILDKLESESKELWQKASYFLCEYNKAHDNEKLQQKMFIESKRSELEDIKR
jgi:arsenate reductase-like glutaredoxin family protein